MSPSGQPNEEHCSKLEDKTTGHKLDDKVWVFINDELCGGFLKYIGRVPGGGSATLAGINMVCDSLFDRFTPLIRYKGLLFHNLLY